MSHPTDRHDYGLRTPGALARFHALPLAVQLALAWPEPGTPPLPDYAHVALRHRAEEA